MSPNLITFLMYGVRIGAVGPAISTVVFRLARGVTVIIEGLIFFRENLRTI